MSVEIERARRSDQSEVFRIVEQNHLPVMGLDELFDTVLVARQDGRIVGTAALEMYRDGAVLRSVAVAPDEHRKGIGHQLTDAALALAHELEATGGISSQYYCRAFLPEIRIRVYPAHRGPCGCSDIH